MRRSAAAAVVVPLLVLASVAACSNGGGSGGAGPTDPERTKVDQASPKALMHSILSLRDNNNASTIGSLFIAEAESVDASEADEITSDMLCSSDTQDCDYYYTQFINGQECAEITAGDMETGNFTVSDNNKTMNLSSGDNTCELNVVEIDGKWWVTFG